MQLFFIIILGICLTACVPKDEGPRDAKFLVISIDQSGSGADNAMCEGAGARIATHASQGTVEVLILGSGDKTSSGAPNIIVGWSRSVSPAPALFKDPSKQTEDLDRWVQEVVKRCKAKRKTTKSSPIFRLVERSAESLRAKCAALSNQRCSAHLAIHSDLHESANKALLAHFRGKRRKLPALPTLDLTGIDTKVCTGEHRRDQHEPARVQAVWRKILGPSVHIEVACPRMPKELLQ